MYGPRLEGAKHKTRNGEDYWTGRSLQPILQYDKWENFVGVIEKARLSCKNAGFDPDNHFLEIGKKVEVGSGAMRERADWYLSRYASYLVAMNGDPGKDEVAAAQSYFAFKARQQEMSEEEDADADARRRLGLRKRIKEANKSLVETAKGATVPNLRSANKLPFPPAPSRRESANSPETPEFRAIASRARLHP